MSRFARSLGSRPSDPDYCSAIERPRHNHAAWWIAGCTLLACMVGTPWIVLAFSNWSK